MLSLIQRHTIGYELQFLEAEDLFEIPMESFLTGAPNDLGWVKHRKFVSIRYDGPRPFKVKVKKVKSKQRIAVSMNLAFTATGNSHAIWDRRVLPATRQT